MACHESSTRKCHTSPLTIYMHFLWGHRSSGSRRRKLCTEGRCDPRHTSPWDKGLWRPRSLREGAGSLCYAQLRPWPWTPRLLLPFPPVQCESCALSGRATRTPSAHAEPPGKRTCCVRTGHYRTRGLSCSRCPWARSGLVPGHPIQNGVTRKAERHLWGGPWGCGTAQYVGEPVLGLLARLRHLSWGQPVLSAL